MRLLIVCTANVCRSPLGAASLEGIFARSGIAVVVASAGVDAEIGSAACPYSSELSPQDLSRHRSRQVEADDLRGPDLILALDRTQRASLARLSPQCRPRLFTLVQASLLAEYVGRQVELGEFPADAPPLPTEGNARIRWLVAEMDAARGMLAAMGEGALDIEDVHGPHDHSAELARVMDAAANLATWITRVGAPSFH